MAGTVRRAAVAGSWYRGSAHALAAAVDRHLASATRDVDGDLVALVAPHAGLMYSAPVAATPTGSFAAERSTSWSSLVRRISWDSRGLRLPDRRLRDAAGDRGSRYGSGQRARRSHLSRARLSRRPRARAFTRDAAAVPAASRPRRSDRPAGDGASNGGHGPRAGRRFGVDAAGPARADRCQHRLVPLLRCRDRADARSGRH